MSTVTYTNIPVASKEAAWLDRGAYFVETLALASCCTTALLLGTMMGTAVTVLGRLDGPTPDIQREMLSRGQLWGLLTGPTLWQSYPQVTSPLALWNGFTASLVIALVGGVLLWAWRGGWRASSAGVSLLLLGAIPYTCGAVALADGSMAPEHSGPWVAVMILGVFYASCASGVWCLAHLAHRAIGSKQWWGGSLARRAD